MASKKQASAGPEDDAALVYALTNAALVAPDGLTYRVLAGQPWDAGDPLVQRHPGFFAPNPRPEHVGRTQPNAPLPAGLPHAPGSPVPGRLAPENAARRVG